MPIKRKTKKNRRRKRLLAINKSHFNSDFYLQKCRNYPRNTQLKNRPRKLSWSRFLKRKA